MAKVEPFNVDMTGVGTGVRIAGDSSLDVVLDDSSLEKDRAKWTAREVVLVRVGPEDVRKFWICRPANPFDRS